MRDGGGFLQAGRAAPRDFPRPKPKGNPKDEPCQLSENLVLPNYFIQIFILFAIRYTVISNAHPIFSKCLTTINYNVLYIITKETKYIYKIIFLGCVTIYNFYKW